MIASLGHAAHTVVLTLAQSGAVPTGDAVPPDTGMPTLGELFLISPVINGAILLLSLIALAVFVIAMLSLTRSAVAPSLFVDDVTKLIINRRFDQAINLCQNHGGVFVASIVRRVVENREQEPGVLMGILEAEGKRRAEIVWTRIGYLTEVATIAPTLGLLGTVIGMIKVFFTLTERIAGTNVGDLSEGIAQAMGTTMFGLIVALIAGVCYAIARSMATSQLAEAEQICHTIADHTHRAARQGAAVTADEDEGDL